MIHLTHRRGELLCVRSHDNPDMRLSTALEMGGLKRHITGHLRVIAAVSPKLADRVRRLAPESLTLSATCSPSPHWSRPSTSSTLGTSCSMRRPLRMFVICSHLGVQRRSSARILGGQGDPPELLPLSPFDRIVFFRIIRLKTA